MSASKAARHASNVIAMNDVKGPPRDEGFPVSNRSDEFKDSAGTWLQSFAPDGFTNAWDASRNNLTSPNARFLAIQTR